MSTAPRENGMRYATGETSQNKLHLLQILPPISAENSEDIINKVNSFPSFDHVHSATTHNTSTTVCTDTSIVSNELEDISNNQEAISGDNPLMILEGIHKKFVKI